MGCHLCEHAEALLDEYRAQLGEDRAFELDEIDISSDERLVELYGIRIPVVKNAETDAEIGWPFGIEEIARLF